MIARLKTAARGAIAPFIVMDVLRAANEQAAAGHDVLHLEVGQPSAAAPRRVRMAAARALRRDRLGYTDALGYPPLRQAIAADYRDRRESRSTGGASPPPPARPAPSCSRSSPP
ncbi:MAG TPA: hypothetical protein VLR47_13690, partial [Rhodospirillales bacterium]|nr:hypothetical protein [Rhodospirillales bacterium]